jgi:hypothetical protein
LKLSLIVAFVVFSILGTLPALAYGHQGHETIGEIARQRLNPKTSQAIKGIIGSDDLAGISTWADDLKQVARNLPSKLTPEQTQEAREFNQKFTHNGDWHFCNFPLDATYDPNSPFARRDDAIHIIQQCILVLESPQTPLSVRTNFTKAQALRLLVHLVGDIHQPLHVGCGFYDLTDPDHPKLLTNPAKIQLRVNQHDKGGNDLRYSKNARDQLHSYWDTTLVEKLGGGRDYHRLASLVLKNTRPEQSKDTGDHHKWPEIWATDSISQAKGAYRGIQFLKAYRTKNGRLDYLDIQLPLNYASQQSERAMNQLAKAGVRLANLLNSINWK